MPNDNYCKFEDWLMPILEQMVDEQETQVGAGGGCPGRLGPPRLGVWGGGVWGGPGRLGPPRGVLSVVVLQGVRWTPSKMIARLGKEIDNPESICYWAQKVGGDLAGGGGATVTRGVTGGCHHPSWPVTASPSQNNIPVLSPALTDGSLGDMIFFHSYKRPGLVLDIVEGECVPVMSPPGHVGVPPGDAGVP